MQLKDKIFLVTGIASTRSIAYSIAHELSQAGAKLILTCQNEKLAQRVSEFTQDLNVLACEIVDLTSKDQLLSIARLIEKQYNSQLDGIVHAVAYAPADQLKGSFHEVLTHEGFQVSHEVSSYTFCLLAQVFHSYLKQSQGSLVTLSYLGSERYVPNYNVMGLAKASLEASVRYLAASMGPEQIRVNAISAGPIKTLAASGISGFKNMLNNCASQSMLKRNVEPSEVAKTALFLLSHYASGITGEVLHVDCGFSKTAMVF